MNATVPSQTIQINPIFFLIAFFSHCRGQYPELVWDGISLSQLYSRAIAFPDPAWDLTQ